MSGRIAVITDDCRYDFKATAWRIDNDGTLTVTQHPVVVAEFHLRAWLAVFDATQEIEPVPAGGAS